MKERGGFRILLDTYVTEDSGTGVVHQAPYFGEVCCIIYAVYGRTLSAYRKFQLHLKFVVVMLDSSVSLSSLLARTDYEC